MIIAPLSFRINRLQEQADEMIDFITAIERELDEIERVSGEGG